MTYSMKRLAPVLILPLILLALLLGTANVFAADTPAEAAATRAEAREQAAAEKDARSRDDDDEDDEDDLQVVEEDDEDDEGDEDDDADADDDEDEGIAFEKTPEAVQATIKKVFGDDPDIEEIGRDEDDGEVFYYVGGETSDGEFVELTISGDGQILAHEQEIELDDAPEAIKATVMKVAGATDLAEADLDDVEGRKIVEEGQTHYHFELETGDGSRVGLEMAEDGTIIVREQSIEPENLPADIQKLVKVEVGDAAEIEEAYKIEEADEGARFVVIGEIEDKEFELLASADGSEVEVEVFTEGDDDDDEEDEDDDNEDDDDEEDEDEGDDLEDDEEDED